MVPGIRGGSGGHNVDKVGFHHETLFKATGYAQNKPAVRANV